VVRDVAIAPGGDIVLLDAANQTLDPYDAHGTPLGRRSVALTASTALSLGSDGSVLVAGSGGYGVFAPGGSARTTAGGLGEVRAAYLDRDGSRWIGGDGGVIRFDRRDRVEQALSGPLMTGTVDKRLGVTAMAAGPRGVWLAQPDQRRVRLVARDGNVLATCAIANRQASSAPVAIASSDGAAYVYDGVHLRRYRYAPRSSLCRPGVLRVSLRSAPRRVPAERPLRLRIRANGSSRASVLFHAPSPGVRALPAPAGARLRLQKGMHVYAIDRARLPGPGR
jgi:hypothetical protein